MITEAIDGIQTHHLLRAEGHGMGTKACDRYCVPLHYTMHDMLHKNGAEIEFFKTYGWAYEDVLKYAKELCERSPDKKIRSLYDKSN